MFVLDLTWWVFIFLLNEIKLISIKLFDYLSIITEYIYFYIQLYGFITTLLIPHVGKTPLFLFL